MSLVMLVLGALATAVGAVLIAWGIAINEFSLGNALIVSGTVALNSGLLMIGLSAALRHLQGIAAGLARGSRPHRNDDEEFALAGDAPRGNRGERSFLPGGLRNEPAELVTSPEDFAPRPPVFSPADQPPPTPPSPRLPPRSSSPAPEPRPTSERARDERRPLANILGRGGSQTGRNEPSTRADPAPASGSSSIFDAVWPPEPKEARGRSGRSDHEPHAGGRPNGGAATPASGEPKPVSILKSGVVDGMAYTLYTDGSIEAELAQGVVRFGSIEELRNHLEKNG